MAIEEKDEVIVEEEVIENPETSEEETPDESQEEEATEEEDGEEDRIVTFGDEEPSEEEGEGHKWNPGLVKKLRKVASHKEKEIKRLKRELEAATKPAVETVELGPEPTLESAKFDEKKFKADWTAWNDRKQKVEEQNRQKEAAVKAQQEAWQKKQENYANLKQEHNFKDFQEAEDFVSDTFDTVQQGVIVQSADDPALLVYALGKNTEKAEELAKIKDPIILAAKLGKLEAQLKVKNRKAPKPETRVSAGATNSGTADDHLTRLREKAARTGDYSEVAAYKKQLRGAK